MNFVLLGDDSAAMSLILAVMPSAEHRVTHAVMSGALSVRLKAAAGGIRIVESWEDLLLDDSLDVLVVAGHRPDVLTAAKQLGESCSGIIVFPRAEQGLAFIYELSLLRDASNVTLFPAFALRGHPHVVELAGLVSSGSLGEVRQLDLERVWRDTSGPHAASASDCGIDEWQLHDVDLVRLLGGNYDQVTALRSRMQSGSILRATLALTGPGCPDASWSARVADAAPTARLAVTGSNGSAVLEFGANSSQLTTQIHGVEARSEKSADERAIGEALLRRFFSAASGAATSPDWADVTRAFEIVDAAHRSIRRRRTIDLHFESTSERSLFKSQMTAIGCGLLLLTLFCMLLLLLLGATLDARDETFAKAEQIGFVIREGEFEGRTDVLTADAHNHISKVALQMQSTPYPVYVEAGKRAADERLTERRRHTVTQALKELGVEDADSRTTLVSQPSAWRDALMKAARWLWLLPLLIFLGLQLLLFMTKPAQPQRLS